MNSGWDEGVTWNTANPLANQGVEIGSINPDSSGSWEIVLNTTGQLLVEGWINGATDNNGIMIVDNDTSDSMRIRSSEYATNSRWRQSSSSRSISRRPMLTITYQ